MVATIKDIAKLANVSRGTVDRALNDRPGVNREVAERVRKIADELGYRPNRAGKALAANAKKKTLGVIVNNIGNPFFDDVLEGIRIAGREIQDYYCHINMINLRGYHPEEQLAAIQRMKKSGIDGLAITPVSSPIIRDALNELIDGNIPVVCLNMDIPEVDYLAYVGCDYFKSGETIGGMIGLVMGGKASLGIIACCADLSCHHLRLQGCKNTLESDFPQSQIIEIVEAEDDDEIAYQKTRAMLMSHPEINALCFTAGGVVGGLQAVRDLNASARLKIFTFDVTPAVERSIQDGLVQVTVDQNPRYQGYKSIEVLFEGLVYQRYPPQPYLYTDLTIFIKQNLPNRSSKQ